MSTILVVLLKEMIDNIRDRRSLMLATIYPLFGPILLGLMITYVGSTLKIEPQHQFAIHASGMENAPELARYMRDHGVAFLPAPEDAVTAVRRGFASFVLSLPRRQANPAEPLEVTLLEDASRISSVVPISQIIDLLHGYEHDIVSARLRAAGVAPDILTPLQIRQENVGRSLSLGATVLNVMPPFFIFTLFLGGAYLTLDTTSGERERGSFEPLMINPVSRSEVLIGKFGAAVVFTIVALIVQIMAFWLMTRLVPRDALGLVNLPSAARLMLLLPVCLPLALFAVAAQLVIAAVTRSLKEAQTYLGLLPLVPAIAGMLLVFAPVELHSLLAAIPTFGQTVLMGQVVRSEAMSWAMISISGFSTIAVVLLLLVLVFRLYEREQILFPP